LAQVRFDDDTYVTTECEQIGNKSFTLLQRIYDRREGKDATVKTESRSVMVAFDFETQEAVPIPDEWRENLSR
jgi:acyl-CoA thioesterase FadM